MKLKTKYRYGDRWSLDEQYRDPISATSFDIYEGYEDPNDDGNVLTYRPVILKSLHYQPGTTREDVIRRRQAFDQQLSVLALGHFMLPEPYDYCRVTDHHTPVVAGGDLADSEPLLVYSFSPGATLREYVGGAGVRTGHPLAPLEALDIVRRIASFLTFLHNAGYGHIAVNPDHFLHHRGSLRAVGFSKIVPLDTNGGRLIPYEPPFFGATERAFLPGEALMSGSFSLGTECYGLGMLLYYLLSGRCPSTLISQPRDRLPWDKIDQLAVCRDLKLLIDELTSWPNQQAVARLEQVYNQQLDLVFQAQKDFEEDTLLGTKQIGIFVDLENIVASFTPRGDTASMPLDLEAIAAAYSRHGPTHKFVVVPRHRTRGRIQGAISQLMRSGWRVRLVDPLISDDGRPIMGEVDDSYLIQAGNRFLEKADARRVVVISNDSDYKLLLEKACFKGCDAHIAYGHLRGASRPSISNAYLRELEVLGVTAHLIHSYPFVFERETVDFCKKVRLFLPPSRSYRLKMLVWEIVQQLGYEGALSLFSAIERQQLRAIDLLRNLQGYPVEYYPALIQMLGQSQRLREDAERVRMRRYALTNFSPHRFDILRTLFQLPDNRAPLLKRLAETADVVEAEWDFLKMHLNEETLLRLFLGSGRSDGRLRDAIKAAPDAIQDLIRKHNENDIIWVMDEFGADALSLLQRFGKPTLSILRKYQMQGFQSLAGPLSDALLRLEANDQTRALLEEWYQAHQGLTIVESLQAEPSLAQLAHNAGIFAVEIYQRERSLVPVLQSTRIAALTFRTLEEAYELRKQLHTEGFQVEDIIKRLEIIQKRSTQVFRGRRLGFEEYANLVKALYRAVDEDVVDALAKLYVSMGPPILVAYRQFGRDLFPLIERTQPAVVNVLNLFPDLFPDLQKYGRPAYDLIRSYRDAAHDALVRLRNRDLAIFLGSPPMLSLLKDWHTAYQDLRAMDFLVTEPQLAEWAQQYGVSALELYAEDQDLSALQNAIQALPHTGLSLHETHALFKAVSGIPQGVLLNLIANYRALFSAQTDTPARARLLSTFHRATAIGVIEDLAALTEQVGPSAISAFDQFGLSLFPVVNATSPTIVNLLALYPDLFPDVQRYGRPVYDFVRSYRDAAFDALRSLRHVDLTPWLTDPLALILLSAWYHERRDLRALDLFVEQPRLLDWVRRYGALTTRAASVGEASQPETQGLRILQLYAADHNSGLLSASLALAEEGHLPFQEIYTLLQDVGKPMPVARSIIIRHSARLRALPDTATRSEFLKALCDAQSQGIEDDIVDLFDAEGQAALQVYHRVGRDVILLAQQISPKIVHMLAQYPDLFESFKRYGQPAFQFVQRYGPAGADKLLKGAKADMSNILSDEAQPIIQTWYQSRKDVDIVNLLLLDWPIMRYIKQYNNDLKVVDIWLALWHQRQIRTPSTVIEQYESVLFNSQYDYKQLIPLITLVEPRQLELATNTFYHELLAYPQTEDRVRLCKVLTETLDFSEDAGRYMGLAKTVDRLQLLALAESAGRPVVDLLEILQPLARAAGMQHVLALPPQDRNSYLARLWIYRDEFRGWPESTQVKAIQATQRQPVDIVTQAWRDYGDLGLDEILKSGKLGFLFKLTHRRRD